MKHTLTLAVSYDDDRARWCVSALSQWAETIELCRSTELSPFASYSDVSVWLHAMFGAWVTPTLGQEASESLHDAFIDNAV